MPHMSPPELLYLGLRFTDWINLCGLILGPVIAVVITLVIDGRRRKREQRIQVMRMLLTTRHLPSDPMYSVAINLIPIEFNQSSKVMAAWHTYIEAVRYAPTPDNRTEHDKVVSSKQTKLVYETMLAIGFKLSETDIQTSAYAADGYVKRDNILIASQIAMTEIATTLKRQTDMMAGGQPTLPPSGPQAGGA